MTNLDPNPDFNQELQKIQKGEEGKTINTSSILIVDDTIYNIQLLSLMLIRHGYVVEQATNGQAALEKAAKILPDIILLDIRMPDIDGYEVCKILKANPTTQGIPIIFISSIEEPSEKVEAFSVGGVDYISKPFQLIEVLARIETHLRLCSLQKKLQEQNEQLQLSASVLARSLTQERELSEMKTNFISVVSHEFRTPLTTIQSAAELLEHYEWTKEEQTEQLHQIQSEVKHMTELMEDVLFLSRTNANKAKLNITEFDLLKFCKQLLRQIQRTFGKEYNLHSSFHHPVNDISIENPHLQQDIPQFLVHMDEKLLRQILSNLITNAIKYSPKNKDIDFQIIVDQEKIIFIVSDHGIGIPEEDLSHLFSTFHRGKNVGILPGTGLGLSIVKNCVDTLNGLISVKSQLNIGTEFRVTLPIDNHLKT
ncbi:MAG: ATP-binding protein [Pseudanabaena sp.]|jgi:two-component system sensor histidine kinase/response regulator|uniref:hybrid sensor histidine kinase/response regulator n=1 Tax=Pseudanabaena mucicola TaxID=71190 RepID=UPI002576723D|nr:hybrid sensor histidine kinase/response regulator [Pseudanabaena mucicola]MCA6574373.1 hybrid sensor histidine kinase/response regulator [Pseudanabaena sp. M53BS1SP1A06MG]MCA6583253.1 hybrid sensor histidine kinase/response regulator [Pseudanabaena sp. M34BS1SP1A06MG]MCA6585956.1 hybrid sensor histidine kinase/response regulator [Pseudanabaena sp. M051S1SP1A06QC]MCA6587950.1 hybrid sensor histidine kinase/response regulator [Pseudanabaena sp. M109S1SP1A06QC]MCA6591027.1 hybrid sensor histid